MTRLKVLDGWRGISISLVLAGHLLPLGPKALDLNSAVAGFGMAIFFTLSGFLITSVLLKDASVARFLIHRLMRIVPLAWLASIVTLLAIGAGADVYLPHLFFYANKEPMTITFATQHFWSLCVEVQFYAAAALLVLLAGRRGLYALPVMALVVTAWRIANHKMMVINTEFRVDEILSGCALALAYHRWPSVFERRWWSFVPWVLVPLLLLSAHPAGHGLDYARPYIASLLVGSTLGLADASRLRRLLSGAVLGYLANISYALYIVHGCLMGSWLASGDTLVRYLKRPLLFAATFALAHFSTRYYERFFIELGRRWARRFPPKLAADSAEIPVPH